jgi:hypothetical protein
MFELIGASGAVVLGIVMLTIGLANYTTPSLPVIAAIVFAVAFLIWAVRQAGADT